MEMAQVPFLHQSTMFIYLVSSSKLWSHKLSYLRFNLLGFDWQSLPRHQRTERRALRFRLGFKVRLRFKSVTSDLVEFV